jgi:hypothetical protein
LSPGAAAGIGVGVTLGFVLIVAAIGYLLFQRMRRRSGHSSVDQVLPHGASASAPPMQHYKASELPTKPAHFRTEAEADNVLRELDANNVRATP